MNLGLRILRAAGVTLAVVVGLPVGFVLWTNHSWVRQDINAETGEIREIQEGVLWDSSPTNIHETTATTVLKKYSIGMQVQGEPWMFFNRVHAFAKMGGDWPLEEMLFTRGDLRGSHIHYGDFLEAVATYRSREEAALWWKTLMAQQTHWRETQIYHAYGFREILRDKTFASSADFNAWYTDLMHDLHNDPSRARFIPLFDELYTLFSNPSPTPRGPSGRE